MAYKVAVVSTDGKFVNEHFGRATQFLIFEVTVTEILQGCLRKKIRRSDFNE